MSRRMERVNEMLQHELALLVQGGMRDPRLAAMVTILRVRTSPDMKRTDVYVSVFGSEVEQKQALTALQGATGFLRRALGEKVRLKHLPELFIHHDRSLQEGDNVLRLISELEHQEPEASEPGEGPGKPGEEKPE